MLIVNSQGCALRKIEGLDSPVFWNCNMQGVQRMLFMKKKKKLFLSDQPGAKGRGKGPPGATESKGSANGLHDINAKI